MRYAFPLCLAAALVPGASLAQTAAPPPAEATSGADQVVGLFGATCLHFAGDVAGMRRFLTEQGAPQMPAQARDAFLAGRSGEVFDVSYRDTRLALVSLDDGGCEAVADKADPAQVVSILEEAARENHVPLQPLGGQPQKERSDVTHQAFAVTLGGHMMHILVSTAPSPPQAVLTLATQ